MPRTVLITLALLGTVAGAPARAQSMSDAHAFLGQIANGGAMDIAPGLAQRKRERVTNYFGAGCEARFDIIFPKRLSWRAITFNWGLVELREPDNLFNGDDTFLLVGPIAVNSDGVTEKKDNIVISSRFADRLMTATRFLSASCAPLAGGF